MLIHHMVTPANRQVLLAIASFAENILSSPPYVAEENDYIDSQQPFVKLERVRLPLLKYRVMQQRAPPSDGARTRDRLYIGRYAEGRPV